MLIKNKPNGGRTMLTVFATKKDDLDLFKKKIDELNEKLDKKEQAFQIFLNELHKELITAIEQNKKVNKQHTTIGEMVERILTEFHQVENSITNSNEISNDALDMGSKLIEISEKMVQVSQNSQDSISAVKSIIDRLGNEFKKTSQNMN